jgi:hypothetical protein
MVLQSPYTAFSAWASTPAALKRIDRETLYANAHRLAAAWNVCEGISTEALEQWLTPPDGSFGAPHGTWSAQLIAMWEVKTLEKSRHDALLEALKKIARYDDDDMSAKGKADIARAAIAKVTGAAS